MVAIETPIAHVPDQTVPYYPIPRDENHLLHQNYINYAKKAGRAISFSQVGWVGTVISIWIRPSDMLCRCLKRSCGRRFEGAGMGWSRDAAAKFSPGSLLCTSCLHKVM